MKKVIVLLIVLALSVVGGLNLASAQEGTNLEAITLDAVSVLAAPSEGAEVVVELPASTTVSVTGTDETGTWLEVEAADGAGFAPAGSFLVLNLTPLAPKAYVATRRAGATALYATPNITGEYITQIEDGTVATVLGTLGGEWAYVQTAAGTGWSILTDWEVMPEGSTPMVVVTRRVPEVGVYAEANLTSELAGTIPDGTLVYWLAAPEGQFVQVLLPDASMGYAITTDFDPLPATMVVAETGRNGTAAIYAEASFTGEILSTLDDGAVVYIVSSVDDYWYEVFYPGVGSGFTLKNNFSNVFTVATIQVADSTVRNGPNDNVYDAVAVVPAGMKVVVKGVDNDGSWIQVGIPFSEVDFGYNGVAGWVRDYLFVAGDGSTDLDKTLLAVTAAEE